MISLRAAIRQTRITLIPLLVIAIIGVPYEFYTILRVIAFAIFAVSAFTFYRESRYYFMVFWSISAIFINPFSTITLSRLSWQIIDGLWIVIIIFEYVYFRKK